MVENFLCMFVGMKKKSALTCVSVSSTVMTWVWVALGDKSLVAVPLDDSMVSSVLSNHLFQIRFRLQNEFVSTLASCVSSLNQFHLFTCLWLWTRGRARELFRSSSTVTVILGSIMQFLTFFLRFVPILPLFDIVYKVKSHLLYLIQLKISDDSMLDSNQIDEFAWNAECNSTSCTSCERSAITGVDSLARLIVS